MSGLGPQDTSVSGSGGSAVVVYDIPVASADSASRGLKVLWALLEAGKPFDFKATYPRQNRVPPEFPGLNPIGQVPLIACDGGLVLSEASAIIVYVAKKWAPALYPFPSPEEQARADRLLYFATTTLEDVCLKLIFTHGKVSLEYYTTEPHSAECFQWGCRLWRERVLPATATFLGDQQYALGGDFTVVDIALAYPLLYMERMGFFEEGYSGQLPCGNDADAGGPYTSEQSRHADTVKAYLRRAIDRPAFREALAYGDGVLAGESSRS
eukprot:CAMPEP_0177775918 /NCGR_PEP_ID=MMETSP0491_2-20121128/14399_1 /TAXON_ID=63592 /ORGANISM="Tetraselmis chuii, Strain PLY429" /LENGTH=267 /DNA_ID=CAMNT_0019294601 /DNA_START=63 /DNA_END=866 /DNA_ORIENTATION=-